MTHIKKPIRLRKVKTLITEKTKFQDIDHLLRTAQGDLDDNHPAIASYTYEAYLKEAKGKPIELIWLGGRYWTAEIDRFNVYAELKTTPTEEQLCALRKKGKQIDMTTYGDYASILPDLGKAVKEYKAYPSCIYCAFHPYDYPLFADRKSVV